MHRDQRGLRQPGAGCLALMKVDFKDPRVQPERRRHRHRPSRSGCVGRPPRPHRVAPAAGDRLEVRRRVAVHRRRPGPGGDPVSARSEAREDQGEVLLGRPAPPRPAIDEDERMVRDAARAYCQDKLAPRVLEASATRRPIRRSSARWAKSACSGRPSPSSTAARPELRLLRPDRARSRARGLGLPLDDERAVLAGDGADLRIRHSQDKENICPSSPAASGSAASASPSPTTAPTRRR
jgi:hypothetical protein